MTPSTTVQGVLLDADGVVQSTPAGWLASLEALVPPEEAQRFTAAVFAAEAPCIIGRGDFPEALAEVLSRFDCEATLEEALSLWRQVTPHAAVLEATARLRESGTLVGLATNQQAVRAHHMRETLGYTAAFDALYFSCELGHAKPDPRFFSAIVESLGWRPEALFFIDDREVNVLAAREVGLRAARFDARDGVTALVETLRRRGLRPLDPGAGDE